MSTESRKAPPQPVPPYEPLRQSARQAGDDPAALIREARRRQRRRQAGLCLLYVVRLRGRGRALRQVPSSAPLYARLAWSVRGSWLLYQGPGPQLWTGHLWAYRPATGQLRSSAIACCQYTVLAAMPG